MRICLTSKIARRSRKRLKRLLAYKASPYLLVGMRLGAPSLGKL